MRKFLLVSHLAFVALAAHAECEMLRYQRVQASPHVHVFEAAEGTTGVVNGNIVAVIGKDAILVVDTGQIPSVARRVAAEIRQLSKAPVRYIVNTHWHGDHLLGNAVFREAFPEARIVAHSHTIEQAAKYYTDYAAKSRKRLPIAVADMKKEREAATSAEAKLWITKTLECVDAMLPEVEVTHYVAPDLPMDTEMRIDLGGVSAVARHIGPGNTPGDLIVWVEGDRLVATGDMVVSPVPYAIGSAIEPWRRTLGSLYKLGAAIVVPGHGKMMRDDTYIRDVEGLLVSTRSQLVALHARGVTRADAAKLLDVAAFRGRYITTPMRREAFDQFFVKAAIAQIWPKP